MKKIFKMMFAVVAGVAALTACTNEPEENITPDATQGITVKAQLGEATRAILADGESIKWEANDQVTAWYIDEADNYSYEQREEATATVSEDGYTATLNYTSIPVGSTLWLAYNSNTGYNGCSARKVEFNYTSNQTQAAAGAMNKEYLRLVGEQTDVVATEGEYTANMNIVGTIMRYLIYSAEGTYAAEKVQKVELVSSDKALAGGGAAIAYNFAEYYDSENGYKYWANDAGTAFSDECTIFWDATSKSITTTLQAPMALSATDAASSKGIYMTVPALSIGGYKYVVSTDVAIYTFDASTTPVVFANNTLKNVKLDVEKATSRVELSAVKGDLQYTGDLNAASQLISYQGVTDKDAGYWYAQTRDTGADWVTKEGAANAHYYTGVAFECIDNATGLEADWLTVSYRTDGNTHWFMTVQPNESSEQRSATVTATFPDVDGYLVTEACKTKTITVTQQGFTTTKTLGFYGGVGDKTISGAGADKLSLGYCVITVNGIYAESWGDNKNNEQELYGNVVIECRDGGAGAPIVDWLTVEYGKDGEGKFNSTHLLATATENTTGAERRALVCCTYNAPEGYEFEGGAKSAFRQFFVIQPANSGVKEISFWGGIGAEFTHNATAQQDWGLSYWVINVDGATATDWGGDSRNEQLLYGSAEFKCYDYTSGVRGQEIDWVTVEYKKDGNGKIIDTWWLADIQENTGAPRAAEIVCTWPEIEGYTYKDGQRVKSTIIRQEGVTTGGGEDEGDDEPIIPGEASFSYTIFNNAADGSKGTGFGPGAGTVGDWYRFENININGKTYTPGNELKELASSELMAELMAQAFSFGEITDEDVQIPGVDPLTTNPESFVTLEPWCDGGAAIYVRIVLSANDSGARRTFKIITKDGKGEQVSSIVYFQN